jgi:hypothetical protein
VITAVIAGIGRATCYTVVFSIRAAFFAFRNPTRKSLIGDMPETRVIVREFLIEILNGVPKMFRDRLLNRDVFPSGHD